MNRIRTRWRIVWLLAVLLLASCAAAPQMAQSEAPAAEMPRTEGGESTALAYDGNDNLNAGIERKVIGRASLSLVVADTESAAQAIEQTVAQAGGFVANANFYKSGPSTGQALAGSMTLRVPAEGLDALLAQLEELALSVESRTISREDVTDQYTDLTARLTNLQATERELLALLTEVRERPGATAEEILQVHARMSEIRGELEVVQGRRNMLDNLIGLATVEVNLTPDALNRPIVEAGWQPTGVARSALRGLVNALQWLGSAAIWLLIFFLPLALVAAIPVVVLIWVLRWLIRRTRQRREESAPEE
ncbi:MAG: DUF4349 domain-containing protein [Caldilineaceae bacterium]|nr:DUF4349 domain-containing protein [Caldilineaceae bacterium]